MYNKLKDLNTEIIKITVKSSYSFDELFRKLEVCSSPQNRFLIKNRYSVDHFNPGFYRKQNAKHKDITKKCPVCGIEFNCKDSGRDYKTTCSYKCSSLFFKRMSPEIAAKISKKLKGTANKHKGVSRGGYKHMTRKCQLCSNDFKSAVSNRKYCSLKCSHNAMRLSVSNGLHKGWQARNILSYPERYFKKILEDLNLRFIINHPVSKVSLAVNASSCYFLDFFFEDKKVDLEIDGKQHERIENTTSDKIRDTLLKANGYNIFRIKWYNPINEKNKNVLYSQIQNFLKWYEELPLV